MEKTKKIALKMIAFFYRDLHWKLLSLALAMLLWYVGIYVNNPLQTVLYEDIRLNVMYTSYLERSGVVLLNESELNEITVDVRIRATRNDHAQIAANPAGIITARLDLRTDELSNIETARGPLSVSVPVDIRIENDIETIVQISPNSVTVELDKFVQESKDIIVEVTGTPNSGYEERDYTCSESTVQISGAKTAVDRVNYVLATANIQDAENTFSQPVRLVAYDYLDNDITYLVTLSNTEIYIEIPILPVKRLPLETLLTGEPANGYMITGVTVTPAYTEIVGGADTLAELDCLTFEGIDLNNASATIIQTFNLNDILPEADPPITLRSGTAAGVVVTVGIERVTLREVTVPLERISVSGTLLGYTFPEQPQVKVMLRGRESLINNLTVGAIYPRLNLSGLSSGTHDVPLEFSLPNGVVLSNTGITVAVTVGTERPQETSDPTDSSGEEESDDPEGTSKPKGESDEEYEDLLLVPPSPIVADDDGDSVSVSTP